MNGNDLRIGIIGGSGVGRSLAQETIADDAKRHEIDTPFGKPSDVIIQTEWSGVPVFYLSRHGPGHLLNPTAVPYQANIYAMKQLGVTHILATGAVGSLRDEFKPRDLVVPDQVIDKTYKRPATFFDNAAVHVELAQPFCPVLRQVVLDAAEQLKETKTHGRGCYVAMEGPGFSTKAESLMHRLWGGDLIGMTAMPEAKLAREAEISYALIALVTDYDSWKTKPVMDAAPPAEALLDEIIANLQAATSNATALVRQTVKLLAERRETLPASIAHDALKLAIWSDKSAIPSDEIERLRVLWGKHFSVDVPEVH